MKNDESLSKYNAEGYLDMTAYEALAAIEKEEQKIDKQAHNLLKTIQFLIAKHGFEIKYKIVLKSKLNGKEYR